MLRPAVDRADAPLAPRARPLCDLFEQLGPDAPTRCEGWRTTELAAHLHTREHRLDAGPGLLGRGPFARYTAKLEAEAADRPYDELVAELRDGPPRQWFGRYVPAGDIHDRESASSPEGSDNAVAAYHASTIGL